MSDDDEKDAIVLILDITKRLAQISSIERLFHIEISLPTLLAGIVFD